MQEWPQVLTSPAALAVTALVAVVLIVGLMVRMSRRNRTKPKSPLSQIKSEPSRPDPGAAGAQRPRDAAVPLATIPSAPLAVLDRDTPSDALAGRVSVSAPAGQSHVAAKSPQPLREDNPAAACAAFLARAHSEKQSGAPAVAASTLRDAIRLAASNGLADVHASARLELGELARDEGDLITACEHWQIARGLFHDLKNAEKVKTTEARMSEHGCPTDWVLTDF